MKLSARATILLTFATFGAIVGTHVGALPFIVRIADVSPLGFGVVGTIGMLANICAMSLGGWINRKLDHRSVLLMILPLCFLAMLYTLLVQSALSFGLSVFLLSLSLGTMDLFMNAEGAAVEQESGRPIFSAYHGSAALAMAVFAILSSLTSAAVAPWFGALFCIVPVVATAVAIHRFIPSRASERSRSQVKPVVLPRRVLTFVGLAAGLNVTCESAAVIWAGQLLVDIAPHLAAYSGLGLAFYGLCSGGMRVVGDRIRVVHGDRQVMLVSLAVAIAGFSILALAPGFLISVLAFACVGCGLAIVFPCLFSLSANLVPDGRAAALSFVSAVGGVPRVVTPLALGWLAQEFSLGAVFAACAVLSVITATIIVTTFASATAMMTPALK